jgi:type II secretory ATPase GspE/PulE/Tfp pilus assembly ATPase PilB-like protein
MRDHDAFMNNLHTIELSPMLQLENITQHKFEGDQNDVGYARQLQSVLRREPDVVMVGECVDRESAQISMRAATGERRIYLGMEAKDCFDALQQCRDMVRDPQVVAKGLRAITNQRLIRVLCNSCRQAFKPDERLLRKLNLPVGKIEHFYRPPTEPLLDKKGNEIICQACQGTGYVGRTGVFEIVVIDDATREMIAQNAPIANIRDYCRRAKMHDLKRAGLQKVFEGVTSLDEILRALRFDSK